MNQQHSSSPLPKEPRIPLPMALQSSVPVSLTILNSYLSRVIRILLLGSKKYLMMTIIAIPTISALILMAKETKTQISKIFFGEKRILLGLSRI
jgi:hypothetical protein